MKEYSLEGKKGFGVLFESENWRIAYHVYEEAVNGMRAATQWGMHMDSQETFTLLQGTGYLVVQQQDGQLKKQRLEQYKMYMVECGEPHVLILTEQSKVLITENRNMEHTTNKPMTEEEMKNIKSFIREENRK